MAQFQSKKKKKRQNTKQSVFIFCEGNAEENLWLYLKGWLRNKGVSVRCIIHNNEGGDCLSIIKKAAIQHRAKEQERGAEFSAVIVMMDTDNNYHASSLLIEKKRGIKKPIWKFVLCVPCFEQVIGELIGKENDIAASQDKKQAVRQLTGYTPHTIEWECLLENYNKTPEDIFALSAFAEIRTFFFPHS